MRFYTAKIVLICALITFLFLPSHAFANWGKYTPAETPITFFKKYTSLTVDISPKYSIIEAGVPLTWDVNIRGNVLEDNRVSKLGFYIEFIAWDIENPDIPGDFKDGTVEIKDSSYNVVGTMEFWKTEYDEGMGETVLYRGVVTADEFFKKGECFSLQFTYFFDTVSDYRHHYIFLVRLTESGKIPRPARENGFYTRFGPSYSSDIPRFPIPEIPLGPLSGLAASLLALKFRKART
jgi:hypothetical protein